MDNVQVLIILYNKHIHTHDFTFSTFPQGFHQKIDKCNDKKPIKYVWNMLAMQGGTNFLGRDRDQEIRLLKTYYET